MTETEIEELAKMLHETARKFTREYTPQLIDSQMKTWDGISDITRARYIAVAAEVLKLYSRKEKTCQTPNSNA